MTRRRVFVIGVAALLISGAVGSLASCSLLSARRIAAPYYAKELCSCLFVVGQSEEECLRYVRHDLGALDDAPVIDTDDDATIDYETRSVTVALLLNTATARYQGERLGCRLSR